MKSKQVYDYIKKNNLSGDFIDSLMKGYEEYGSFTSKQKACLIRTIEQDKEIKIKFDRIKSTDPKKFEKSKFLNNIYNFYNERKFLTKRQFECLMAIEI
jgi:hypothetical protein